MKTETINRNSSENQNIKAKFVAREVMTNFSYEMDSILRVGQNIEQVGSNKELPDYEEIENLFEYNCPECGNTLKECTPEELEKLELNEGAVICSSCGNTFGESCLGSEIESEPQQIFEWWIVTEYLYRKLKEKGEPVLEWGNNYYWGRTCTGQVILLDSVISDICEEMEILSGQKYAWDK